MTFRPLRKTGMGLGIAAAVWAVVFAALLVFRGLTQPVSVSTALCYLFAGVFLALCALFAFWTYGCASLRYELDRNGLVIHAGAVRQVVPLDAVKKVTPGELVPLPGIAGIGWPGYHVGRAKVRDIGETLFYSTHQRPGELVYVITASHAYAISPPDIRSFMSDLEAARTQGVEVAFRQAPRRMPLADQPFWLDPYAQGLALLAILLCAATAGVIFANYGSLPNSLAVSFPPLDVRARRLQARAAIASRNGVRRAAREPRRRLCRARLGEAGLVHPADSAGCRAGRLPLGRRRRRQLAHDAP